ncbi:MAG: hypothetical protein IAF38_15495 [Bacteroidia bacterium]|nr:hypothetical protein [Bacteroidia bacterium]
MKKLNFLFSLLILLACSFVIKKEKLKSEWQSAVITIDGKADEWKMPLRFYDPETNLNYSISNNAENLFVCVKIPDEQTQLKIMRSGMQLWIDTLGKTKKHVGLKYPLSSFERTGDEEAPSPFGPVAKTVMEKYRKMVKERSTEMLLSGFIPPVGGMVYTKDSSGVSVCINWDATNSMIYEAVIPFKTFYRKKLVAADSLKGFGFSITTNAIPKPKSKEVDGSQGMTGMNGGGVGAMGGLPSGGSSVPKSPLYDNKTFWINIKMAVKP